MDYDEQETVIIEAIAFWACLDYKNPISKKYGIDLCNLSDEDIEKMSSLENSKHEPLRIENKDDERGFHYTVRAIYPIGISKKGIEEGKTAADIPGMKGSKLGNGSLVRVELFLYTTEFGKKKYNKLGIRRLVVLDYIAPPEKDDPFYEGVE